jgi:hypothetical protein
VYKKFDYQRKELSQKCLCPCLNSDLLVVRLLFGRVNCRVDTDLHFMVLIHFIRCYRAHNRADKCAIFGNSIRPVRNRSMEIKMIGYLGES